jgi:uncharacterized membrane protein
MSALPPVSPRRTRLLLLDLARSAAIVQMICFHGLYDLNHFGYIRLDLLGNPGWIFWRNAIVTQFLLVMGVRLGLVSPDAPTGIHWRRASQTALCSVLVSVATFLLFGPRWIWFGVLHFALLAQLLIPAIRPSRRLAAVAGLACLVAGTLSFPPFDVNALSWIGFAAHKPLTEDFVPLVPWLGMVFLGQAASGWFQSFATGCQPSGAGHWGWRVLAWPGQWPLTVYMVHQPLLFGALTMLGMWGLPGLLVHPV